MWMTEAKEKKAARCGRYQPKVLLSNPISRTNRHLCAQLLSRPAAAGNTNDVPQESGGEVHIEYPKRREEAAGGEVFPR
jgi:hypothetical protein